MGKVKVAPSIRREERVWRARDDLRTLQTALEIKGDRSRLKAAEVEARNQLAALAKVGGTTKDRK
jgi:hypothetical protein